jgi:prepilin-type processing-associated H-X9-DG protein
VGHAHQESEVQTPAATLLLVEYQAPNNYIGTGYGGDSALSPSSSFPCAADAYASDGWYQDYQCPGAPIHSAGWNYGFVDGHVKWMRPEDTLGPTAGCLGGAYPNNHGMWTLDPYD